jgi:hypothetical protein
VQTAPGDPSGSAGLQMARRLLYRVDTPRRTSVMSNLLTPIDVHLLAVVTGGSSTSTSTKTASVPSTITSNGNDLVNTLNALSTTIKDIGKAANKGGFSTTEVLMLGMMLNQSRGPVVFVRHW